MWNEWLKVVKLKQGYLVELANSSAGFPLPGPACNMVGPNTVAKLCNDILFCPSRAATLTKCSIRKTMQAWLGFWGS